MPDFDLLIEMADFYHVEVRDILEGAVSQQSRDVQLAAEYTRQEKQRRDRVMRGFFLAGLIAMIACVLTKDIAGENMTALLMGAVTGVMLTGLMYTTPCLDHAAACKRRLLSRLRKERRHD